MEWQCGHLPKLGFRGVLKQMNGVPGTCSPMLETPSQPSGTLDLLLGIVSFLAGLLGACTRCFRKLNGPIAVEWFYTPCLCTKWWNVPDENREYLFNAEYDYVTLNDFAISYYLNFIHFKPHLLFSPTSSHYCHKFPRSCNFHKCRSFYLNWMSLFQTRSWQFGLNSQSSTLCMGDIFVSMPEVFVWTAAAAAALWSQNFQKQSVRFFQPVCGECEVGKEMYVNKWISHSAVVSENRHESSRLVKKTP